MPRPLIDALRAVALKLPDVEEGVACKGTVVESSTVKVRGKAFLFVNQAHARLKLGPSLVEAAALASKHPGLYQAGAGGWVRITINLSDQPPLDLLQRWIDESYRLFAPSKPAAMRPKSSPRKKAPAKRPR
jgi:predicted DNA-binding protein (MmcQ/YjbR family)